MPEYVAKAFLIHNGEVIEPEGTLTLTEEQAEYLNREQENVELSEEGKLEKLTVPELKDLAKDKGIEGYTKLDKAALIEALKE